MPQSAGSRVAITSHGAEVPASVRRDLAALAQGIALVDRGARGDLGADVAAEAAIREAADDALDTRVTQNEADITQNATDIAGRQPFHGVANRDSLTLSYDPATRKVTITGAAEIYKAGTLETKVTPYVFGAHAATTGGYFFMFDIDGNEVVRSTPWDLETDIPIAYVFYNATLADGIAFYELHDAWRDPRLHARLHSVDGTQIVPSTTAFLISGYVLNSDANADKTLAISSGEVMDEDIRRPVAAVADGGPYCIFWRSGATGEWFWTETASFPFLDNGTNLQYNEFTGATWQLTALTAGTAEFMNVFVFATTALQSINQMFFVVGQHKYATEAEAEAESVGNFDWGNVPFQEIAPLAQITFRRSPSNSNQGKADIRRVVRLLGSKTTIAVGGASPTVAAAVSFVPYGNIAATSVQDALEELDDEKLSLADASIDGGSFTDTYTGSAFDVDGGSFV